jgi:hypothetical protein
LISGVVSGFLGAAAGSFVFFNTFQILTNVCYANIVKENQVVDSIKKWDFRAKNLLIYSVSDFVASIVKAPFEVRKQLIQMYSRDISAGHLARLVQISWLPLAMRDVMFRTSCLSFYYLTTDVQHKPLLKFSIP